MDKLKLIKIIVAVLTFLLVLGLLTALGTIYKRVSTPAAAMADINLGQPQGSSIADYKSAGGNLYLLVKDGGLTDRILVIDPTKPQTKPAIIKLN